MSASPFQVNAARRRSMGIPVTPASRLSIASVASPASPSLSATRPFDWDAARNMRPPPYATPIQKSKARKSIATGGLVDNTDTPRRPRIIRRQSWFERLKHLPSAIAFEISLFPHNVPLPPPLLIGRILGGSLHFIHFLVRYRALQNYRDEDLGWEDMKHEMDGLPSLEAEDEGSGFGWTTPLALLLLTYSILNTLYLFTRFRQYQMLLRTGSSDLPATPHASYVPSTLSESTSRGDPSLAWQFFWGVVAAMGHIWRFILNTAPALPKPTPAKPKGSQVQQLDVWTPGDAELAIFSIYSPVHSLLWFVVNPSNWIISITVMCMTSAQIHGVIQAYTTLIKDKAILAAEVMNEYNAKFVHPRLMPIRKDACIQTSQAEMVDDEFWR